VAWIFSRATPIGYCCLRGSRLESQAVLRALATALVVYLVVVAPWFGRYRFLTFQKKLAAGDPIARTRAYQRMLTRQAALAASVLAIALLSSIPAEALGLCAPRSWTESARILGILLGAIVVSIVIFRYRGDWQFRQLQKMVGPMLPISTPEQLWFGAVGIGAGISEELLYRGFLVWYFWTYFPRLDWWANVVICSIAFGLAHLYQGWRGIAGNAALGFCFGLLYFGTGSLAVPMVVHAAIDLRILAILNPERRERLATANSPTPTAPPLTG
jgi:uncharacterized protein